MYSINFNGEDSSLHGLLVVRRPDIPSPVKKRKNIVLDGFDGFLISADTGYEALEIEVDINYMCPEEQWSAKWREAKKWLNGPGVLSFSDDQDYCYRVYYTELELCERTSKRIGLFTARFICDPYCYRKDGLVRHTIGECTYNSGEECKPRYIITGSGTAVLTVNGHDLSAAVTGTTEIDTELQMAFDANGTVINSSTVGDFSLFHLAPGHNDIVITAGYGLSIIPRWRSL